jgi:folate-binding protein YgfZ
VSVQHTLTPIEAYEHASTSAVWVDRRPFGRLRFEGRDAVSFLHALVSNDVESLQPGQGVYATYLTPQGRMLADLRLYRTVDAVLAGVAPGLAARLLERFDQVIFTEQVTMTDISASMSQFAVIGPHAVAILAQVFGVDESLLDALAVLAHLDSNGAVIARTDDAAVPSFDVWLAASRFDEIASRLSAAGAARVDDHAIEALRIEAARPRFGVDMTEDTIPLEAGLLDRAISTTKGCYVGQEVIIRVLHRGGGRVAKRLMRIVFDENIRDVPEAGATIRHDAADVGRITSAAWSTGRQRVVALGYVHRDHAEAGRRVIVDGYAAELL